jgi:hypothetical protein
MYEDRFELTLEEVEGDSEARECLQHRRVGGSILVDVWSEQVEEWMDDDGAGVFDYEDCPPCDLRTYKLSDCSLSGSLSAIANLGPSPGSQLHLSARRYQPSHSYRWV